MAREYVWQRAERLIENLGDEFDAADLVLAARSVDWFISVQRAEDVLRELTGYGLVTRIKPHAFRRNCAAS